MWWIWFPSALKISNPASDVTSQESIWNRYYLDAMPQPIIFYVYSLYWPFEESYIICCLWRLLGSLLLVLSEYFWLIISFGSMLCFRWLTSSRSIGFKFSGLSRLFKLLKYIPLKGSIYMINSWVFGKPKSIYKFDGTSVILSFLSVVNRWGLEDK